MQNLAATASAAAAIAAAAVHGGIFDPSSEPRHERVVRSARDLIGTCGTRTTGEVARRAAGWTHPALIHLAGG